MRRVLREDLFYRPQVVPLRVPALRERPEDVVMLARAFVRRYAPAGAAPPALGADAIAALRAHPWPGEQAELDAAIAHSVGAARGSRIQTDDLPPVVRAAVYQVVRGGDDRAPGAALDD